MNKWPEDVTAPARRINASLRNRIDEVLICCRPRGPVPAVMRLDVAEAALLELNAPRPVIDRLIRSYVEYRT